MAQPRKVLIAVTSAHAPLYPDHKEPGLFIGEALHPFRVFRAAGFHVAFASEKGIHFPDWLSQTLTGKSGKTSGAKFRSKLDLLVTPSEIKWEQYGIFFAAGGHACLIDYPDAKGLQGIAAKIYDAGGIVSAVCLRPAILPGIIDPKTRKSVIAGKKATGFATKGEEEKGVLEAIKSWNRTTIEEAAASAGATYASSPGRWRSFAIADGRNVTGVNPASAHTTAEEAVKAYENL